MIQSVEQKVEIFERRQRMFIGLSLILICAISVVLNTLHLQSLAGKHTRFLSRLVRIGDFREASLILQEARLEDFTTIRYQSSRAGRSFTLPPQKDLTPRNGVWHRISHDRIMVPIEPELGSSQADAVIFEYNRFAMVPESILLWLILVLVSIPQTKLLKRKLIEKFNRELEIEKKATKIEISQQVRHNLRTPLAALMRIPSRLRNSSNDDAQLVEVIIQQIQLLIEKLDDKIDIELSEQLDDDIFETLRQARMELVQVMPDNIQFSFHIDDIVASAKVQHVPTELRSILGNLVNNSVEAMPNGGRLKLSAKDRGHCLEILVTDSGGGIDPIVIKRVFENGFTVGKSNGSGIGLYHARSQVRSWAGQIDIESSVGIGTTVKITLPINARSKWYVPSLRIPKNGRVIVLDDQKTALELWRQKLAHVSATTSVSFLDADKAGVVEIARNSGPAGTNCFLIDYEIDSSINGLDILEEMEARDTKILVTGHIDDKTIRRQCDERGIGLIPKSQISSLAIVDF